MNILTPEQFKSNVEQWAEARGIYEHSTPFAQLMKATSEIGELCDAIIKGRTDDIKDAVGDVAVCLVNFAKFYDYDLINESNFTYDYSNSSLMTLEQEVGYFIHYIGNLFGNLTCYGTPDGEYLECVIEYFKRICLVLKIDFWECCTLAWNEIKDRKGKMVAGGAFVKEGDE